MMRLNLWEVVRIGYKGHLSIDGAAAIALKLISWSERTDILAYHQGAFRTELWPYGSIM